MNKHTYQIHTDSDTHLYLGIAEAKSQNSETGEPEAYKELAIVLQTNTGADGDGEQVTFLSRKDIDELIAKLTELKEQVTY